MTALIRRLAVAAALTAPWAASQAAPTTFVGENLTPAGTVIGDPLEKRNGFLAAMPATGWSTFENGLEDVTVNLGSGLSDPVTSLAFGSTTVGLTATPGSVFVQNAPIAGRFNTTNSGENYLTVPGDPIAVTSLSFDFGGFAGGGVNAFGFFSTDVDLIAMTLLLVALDDTETSLQMGNNTGSPGNLVFWGFTDVATAYKSVTILNSSLTGGSDFFGLDDFVVGQYAQGGTVSLPGSLSLGLIGLVALAGSRRSQNR